MSESQEERKLEQGTKKKTVKKPPASMKSSSFKAVEDKAVEMLGDDYWDWLEEKHRDYIVNNVVGLKR